MKSKTNSSVSFAPSVSPVEKTISDRIKIARVLCIFFMTFVHIPPGIAEDHDTGVFDVVYFILTRLVGLSSVSLLSVVSGYFIVSSLLKAGSLSLISSKFKTLVIPLVAWNLLMLALLAAYGMLTGNWQDMPAFSPMGVANALLAITEWPLVMPLWFLRDLFVCCLFSPILYVALKQFPATTIVLLIGYTLFGEDLYVLQRPQLLLFFGLGMWLRIAGTREAAIDRAARVFTFGLVPMVAIFLTFWAERILISEMNDALRLTLDTLLRLTMAAGFWQLTELIRKSSAAKGFMRLEPYVFFLFCSHAILFYFGGMIFRRFFGNFGSELFPITFFTLPLLAVVAAVIGLQIINRSRLMLFLFNAGHGVEPLRRVSRDRISVPDR